MTTRTSTLTCNYIDICFPDNLQDHHNRDNELLLTASVHDGMSTDELVEELMFSVDSGCTYLPDVFTDEEIREAIRLEIDPIVSTDFGLRVDLIDEDQLDQLYLYAYLSW